MQVSEPPRSAADTRFGSALRLPANVFRDGGAGQRSTGVRAILGSHRGYPEAAAFVCRKEIA